MDKSKKNKDENALKDFKAADHQDVTVIRVDSHRERRDGFAPRRRQAAQRDPDQTSRSSERSDRGRDDRQGRGRDDRPNYLR